MTDEQTSLRWTLPSKTAKRRIKSFAQNQGFDSTSEMLRKIVQEYMKTHGDEIDLTMPGWGGKREEQEDE